MKIAVRMDDITADMNWENFRFFQGLFKEAGITPLLGIVPDNKDANLMRDVPREDFYEIMKELREEGYVLAMHGCHHLYGTEKGGLFPLNNFSEFAGIPYLDQKAKLRKGKDELLKHDIETDIFMAPGHSFDRFTLQALKELGFTKITDGFGKRPYIAYGFVFYPIAFHLGSSLKKKEGYSTMVIHANTITQADKERYKKIFAEHGKDMISYAEYLEVDPVNRGSFGRAGEVMLATLKRCLTGSKRG